MKQKMAHVLVFVECLPVFQETIKGIFDSKAKLEEYYWQMNKGLFISTGEYNDLPEEKQKECCIKAWKNEKGSLYDGYYDIRKYPFNPIKTQEKN